MHWEQNLVNLENNLADIAEFGPEIIFSVLAVLAITNLAIIIVRSYNIKWWWSAIVILLPILGPWLFAWRHWKRVRRTIFYYTIFTFAAVAFFVMIIGI